MSELSKDAGRRCAALLGTPLPQHKEFAAAWERGEPLEYRYAAHLLPADFDHDTHNQWREFQRSGYSGHLGGHYTCTPNWQNDQLEFRVKGSASQP
jgi:hypothetical protein